MSRRQTGWRHLSLLLAAAAVPLVVLGFGRAASSMLHGLYPELYGVLHLRDFLLADFAEAAAVGFAIGALAGILFGGLLAGAARLVRGRAPRHLAVRLYYTALAFGICLACYLAFDWVEAMTHYARLSAHA